MITGSGLMVGDCFLFFRLVGHRLNLIASSAVVIPRLSLVLSAIRTTIQKWRSCCLLASPSAMLDVVLGRVLTSDFCRNFGVPSR